MNAKARALLVVVTAMFLWMCGSTGMESLGDAMVDMGQSLQDGAMSDASAQSTCGTCTAGSLRVTTAETDIDQQIQGVVTSEGEVVAGPAIVTDLQIVSNSVGLYVTADPCSDAAANATESVVFMSGASVPVLAGARVVVPSGMRLCARSTTWLAWSGYRPYQ